MRGSDSLKLIKNEAKLYSSIAITHVDKGKIVFKIEQVFPHKYTVYKINCNTAL